MCNNPKKLVSHSIFIEKRSNVSEYVPIDLELS